MRKPPPRRDLTCTITIAAPCEAILQSFIDHESLSRWWHIRRAICVPRALGCYAIEWDVSDTRDDILGRLGGVFHGTVMAFDPHRELFVADAYWMAPDADPLGPMAFEVTCSSAGTESILQVRYSGAESSTRAERYYAVMNEGLVVSLQRLKEMLG